jgi:ribitol 2-dehydrogenase
MTLLADKVALVTGASSGIGRATTQLLVAHGVKVVAAARSAERLERLASETGAYPIRCDVTSFDQTRAAVEATVEQFGRIDILFANAGLYLAGEVADGDQAAWGELIDVNVKGVMHAARAALPSMLEQKSGDIIVCSSISGHQAIHWEPVYSASKHAVQSFVHGLRRQLLTSGVRVGAVAPGMVLNELWGISDPVEIDRRAANGEGLRSEDVADAVLFMLTRPSNVTIRDLVMLPRCQDL